MQKGGGILPPPFKIRALQSKAEPLPEWQEMSWKKEAVKKWFLEKIILMRLKAGKKLRVRNKEYCALLETPLLECKLVIAILHICFLSLLYAS